MHNLALTYLGGEGTAADPVQYFEWTKKAAGAGHAKAMYNLALAYLMGVGIPVDVEEHFTWINKAAESGYVHVSMHESCILRVA